MASVYPKAGKWYLHFKDEHGRWVDRVSTARTKTEAKRLAAERERTCERQRLGLEPIPPEDGGGTLHALMTWWLETFSKLSPSHTRNLSTVRKNILESELAPLRLVDVTTAKIEEHLLAKEKAGDCGPQTLNHIRTFLLRAFSRAIQLDRFAGKNPALAVQRRRVPKRKPDFLREDEVRRVLATLDPRWTALFATAIYTGMRKGELLGLKKNDVDFATGLITVRRSHQREGTKGEHEEAIPIAEELYPHLRAAMEASPSEMVFPKDDAKGSPMRADIKLEKVLRRAMGRAGIVLGYEHVCRRKGCGHRERAADAAIRRCPSDQAKLWPKPLVRPITFHHTRHTTGSLMMMAGANPGAVQKVLRARRRADHDGPLRPPRARLSARGSRPPALRGEGLRGRGRSRRRARAAGGQRGAFCCFRSVCCILAARPLNRERGASSHGRKSVTF